MQESRPDLPPQLLAIEAFTTLVAITPLILASHAHHQRPKAQRSTSSTATGRPITVAASLAQAPNCSRAAW